MTGKARGKEEEEEDCPLFFTRNNDLECKSSRFAAVVRRSVADKQLA